MNSKLYDTVLKYQNFNNYANNFYASSYGLNVIKSLILIYGEADIINPILLQDMNMFNNNLQKYLQENEVLDFISDFEQIPSEFISNEDDILAEKKPVLKSNYLEEIQKILIHAIMNNPSVNLKELYNILYIKENPNYNFQSFMLSNFQKIPSFAHEKALKQIIISSDRVPYLSDNEYKLAGFSLSAAQKLDDEQLKIANDITKKSIRQLELENSGGASRSRVLSKIPGTVGSGSGFVDILLLIGIIITIILIVIIVYFCFK